MTVTVSAPRFEHHREALGIGEARPRLSWVVESAPELWRQTAYRVELDRDGDRSVHETESGEQVLVDWPDAALTSRERVAARVSVRGEGGEFESCLASACAACARLWAADCIDDWALCDCPWPS